MFTGGHPREITQVPRVRRSMFDFMEARPLMDGRFQSDHDLLVSLGLDEARARAVADDLRELESAVLAADAPA